MRQRPVDKATPRHTIKDPSLDGHHRDPKGKIRRKRADTILGLMAFEKISAVEDVRLSAEMREDLKSFDTKQMDANQRSCFITEKYGKK